MSVHRIMGLETEYGILAPAVPTASPMLLSGQVITSYGAFLGRGHSRSGWDYEDEAPLQDARGFEVPRAQAHPTQLTDERRFAPSRDDEEEILTANVVLPNGARFYVDHAHPEYSSPEVTNPMAAVLYDCAGEQIMRKSAWLAGQLPDYGEVRAYKNNTDNKGASYGTHENYLMPRSVPFAQIINGLLPFFASRLVITGNGRVGIGVHGDTPGFQISQRADFMEVEVGLETTLKRPLVNTRDEPHADASEYRRLHVIVGDATRCQVATFLKMGTTALVLALIENGQAPAFRLADPVAALQKFSRDTTLTATAKTQDGRQLSALDIQWLYFEAAQKLVAEQGLPDPHGYTATTLSLWEDVLTDLGRDVMLCADRLDWVAKLRILSGYRERDGLNWTHPRLELIDVQFSDLRTRQGIYEKLLAAGTVQTLVSPESIHSAVSTPPDDTRAYFRGRCISDFGEHIVAASWDSVIIDVPGSPALRRIPMMDPHRGTKSHVQELFDQSSGPEDFIGRLTGE